MSPTIPMMMKVKKNRKASGITLKDVIAHIQSMKQYLSDKIEENTRGIVENTRCIAENSRCIAENTRGIGENTAAIRSLTLRIDALEEDLTATIKDTIKIREHVGMATPED